MKRTILGLLAMGLAAAATQAEEPSIAYKISGNSLVIAYTGTLFQSTDAVHWAEVASASNPYVVAFNDKKLFFCAKGETSKNMTIPLSDTVSLDMIWINPGTFTMGSPKDELGRWYDETQHQVTLTQGYWLGKYAVTKSQYVAVIDSGHAPSDLPVTYIDWYEAKSFCATLTEIERAAGRLPEGYEYTLPTEAQWEYACRAGTTTALNSGKNLSDEEQCPEMDEVGWYEYNSDEQTHPVGQKKSNAWGFYDMHGNVWEWCLSRYGDYPTEPVTDPAGPETGSYRVIRGGSWGNSAFACRSALRQAEPPGNYYSDLGFRVALAPVVIPDGGDMTIPLAADVNLDMVWCPPGTFMMGSPKNELGRYDDETQHSVTISSAFWIGKYEVTQSQYKAVMDFNPCEFIGANLPVEKVSWNEAMEFCSRLTDIEREAGRLPEGYEYTLPTEAQWEYACRAGTTTALNSGKDLSNTKECPEMDEVGWYWYNGGREDYYNDSICTHPVGQKKPNAWGIYDMHGNVQEWCKDWYEDDYPSSSVTDPTGPGSGSTRVLRGGCWGSDAVCCRSAYRSSYFPSDRNNSMGFRVALSRVQ